MIHRKQILFIVLATILSLLILIAYQQRNNLKALWIYLTMDSTTVSQQIDESREQLQEKLEKENSVTIKAPSREDNEALLNGKVSPEEVKQAIGIPKIPQNADDSESKQTTPKTTTTTTTSKNNGTTGTTSSTTSEIPKPPEKTADDIVNECVAELYACQVDLMGQLGKMKQTYSAKWSQLPPSQRTNKKKIELGMEGLNQCYGLEIDIDNKVQGILDKYEPKLKEIGADTDVLDTLWDYYCEVKASEKAYYLDKYL